MGCDLPQVWDHLDTHEMVWQVANKVDMEGSKVDLGERFPFLEFDTLVDIPWLYPGLLGWFSSLAFHGYVWWAGLD